MTPDQLQAVAALATILKAVGSLPFGGVLVFLIIGPWVGMILASNVIARRTSEMTSRSSEAIAAQNSRIDKASQAFREHVSTLVASQEKRFEAVVRMYENNVVVVRDYNTLASDLTGIITLSTRTLETLVQKVENNQFCPVARKEIGKA